MPILIPDSIKVLKLGDRKVVLEEYAGLVVFKDGAYNLHLTQRDLSTLVNALLDLEGGSDA